MPTLTIDFTNAQATRIATAFKAVLGVETFNMADYKAWVIEHTKDVVLQEEKRAAQLAIPAPSAFDPV